MEPLSQSSSVAPQQSLEERLGEAGTVYCVHCRESSDADQDDDGSDDVPTASPSSADASRSRDGEDGGIVMAAGCIAQNATTTPRKTMSRCSRCKIVFYCSRACQKDNFKLHKLFCRRIAALRSEFSESVIEEEEGQAKLHQRNGACSTSHPERDTVVYLARQHEMAHVILQMAHRSTDTVERGYTIYRAALLAYYDIVARDPTWPGALECTLLLMALLNRHDDLCRQMICTISSILQSQSRDNGPTVAESGDSQLPLAAMRSFVARRAPSADGLQQPAAWLFGEVGADHSTDSTTENETTAQHPRPAVIDDAKGGAQRWNPNCFLVPMLWMEMRELAQATSSASTQDNVQRKRVDVAELAHLIESTSASWLRQTSSAHAPPLPLMMGLSADSMDAAPWNSAMTVDLLSIAPIRDDHDNEHGRRAAHIFEEDSFTLWHILKDSFAFTPGLYDAWDTTMEAMKAGGMEVANPLRKYSRPLSIRVHYVRGTIRAQLHKHRVDRANCNDTIRTTWERDARTPEEQFVAIARKSPMTEHLASLLTSREKLHSQ